MSTAKPEQGSGAELDQIIIDLLWCTRGRSAWDDGTMLEDYFVPAAGTEVRGELIAWRDAAVRAALAEAGAATAGQVTP